MTSSGNELLSIAIPVVVGTISDKTGIPVHYEGKDAYTDGHKVVIPAAEYTGELASVAYGYTAHEAFHCRYTDFRAFANAAKEHPLLGILTNIIEDPVIEQRGYQEFPGVRSDINACVRYLAIKAPTAEASPIAIFQMFGILYGRSTTGGQWFLQDEARKAEAVMRQTFGEVITDQVITILDQGRNLPNTLGCVALARQLLALIKDTSEDQSGSSSGQGGDPMPSENCRSSALRRLLDAQPEDFAQDVFKQIGKCLTDAARHLPKAPKAPEWKYYTLGAPRSDVDSSLTRLKVQSARLRAAVEALIQATRREPVLPSRSGTRILPQRLSRVSFGDSKVFGKHCPVTKVNTAMHLCLDTSESMAPVIETASAAAAVMANVVEAIPRTSVGISAFPAWTTIKKRSEPCRAMERRYWPSASGSTPMAEGMAHGLRDLLEAREEKKVLIVVSDGDPNRGSDYGAVLEICRKLGVKTWHIGIKQVGVGTCFDHHIVINNVNELNQELIKIARQVLT